MAISFPISPALNQEYTYGNNTWIWSGNAWLKKKSTDNQNTSIAKVVATNTTITTTDKNTLIGVNTTANPITITLPTTPTANFYFELIDSNGTWNTNKVTITGGKILGQTQNIMLDITGVRVGFCYVDATTGWVVMNEVGVAVGNVNTVSPSFTGTPTVNTLPVVSFNPLTNSFVVGMQQITKMAAPASIFYDAQGRVKSYTSEGDTYTLSYNANGQMVSVTNNSETNTIIYDSGNRVIGITLS